MSKSRTYQFITSSGLSNTHAPTLGELSAKETRDRRGTWCSSHACNGARYTTKGTLVHVASEYKNRCPICNSSKVYHNTVTPRQARVFKEKKKNALP
jgi:hypothetical protein